MTRHCKYLRYDINGMNTRVSKDPVSNHLQLNSPSKEGDINIDLYTEGKLDLNNKRQGLFIFYEDNHCTKVFKTVEYLDGVPHGLTCNFRNEYCETDPPGQVRTLINYLESVFEYNHGRLIYSEIYENGSLYEISFENGVMQGYYATYYSNGVVKEQGFRVAGKQHGILEFFNEEGVISRKLQYAGGAKMGTEERFSREGEVIQRTFWFNDLQHGLEMLHDQVPVTSRYEFSFGDRFKVTRNWIHGELTGLYLEQLEGSVVTKGQFENGKRVGLWEFFSLNKRLVRSEVYKDDILEGPITFLANENEVVHGHMTNGKRNGHFYHLTRHGLLPMYSSIYIYGVEKYQLQYDQRGRPMVIGEVSNNKLHGLAIKVLGQGILRVCFFEQGKEIQNGPSVTDESLLSQQQLRIKDLLLGYIKI